jgi:hypothetical protein
MIMEKYASYTKCLITGNWEEELMYTPNSTLANRREAKAFGDPAEVEYGHIKGWIDLSQFKKKKGR